MHSDSGASAASLPWSRFLSDDVALIFVTLRKVALEWSLFDVSQLNRKQH